jgi:lysophospholipase L1-like esterase
MKSKPFKLMILVIAVVLVYDAVSLARALRLGSDLVQQSQAFAQAPQQPAARLLVLGDSTAVGTGAGRPVDSVAGRIGRAFPHLSIVNRGQDGAKTAAVIEQLEDASPRPLDAILIQVGGNDILWFTPLSRLRTQLQTLLRAAKARTDLVVMMSTGDVGRAPAFPWAIDWYYSWQTRRVRALIQTLVAREAVEFVDLYDPRPGNPFYQDPGEYYARDGLHPSAAGYGLWYDRLMAVSSLRQVLSRGP